MNKFLDANHPFFRPVWRRWVTAVVPMAWGVIEALMGSPGWAVLFAGAGIYAFWLLIIKGPTSG